MGSETRLGCLPRLSPLSPWHDVPVSEIPGTGSWRLGSLGSRSPDPVHHPRQEPPHRQSANYTNHPCLVSTTVVG